MNPKAVWMDIVSDQTNSIVETLNPIQCLKETESVTFSGKGGRNVDTMVKSTRGFQLSDLGLISESTPDSGKVGIRTFMSANPNITSVRGTYKTADVVNDPTNTFISTTALICPAINTDDFKRVNFASVQYGHTVPCNNYTTSPLRTGYEEVVANRVDKNFAIVSELDGVVTKITNKTLSVKYKDGSEKTYEIGTIHGVVSGTDVPHNLITDFKVGQKFIKGTVLAFDKGFFERSLLSPELVSYKMGILSRVAFLESADTIEDGCVISDKIAKRFVMPSTKRQRLILDFDMGIQNLVEVGTEVEPDTVLCTIYNAISENIEDRHTDTVDALRRISANNPKAKLYGKISKIDIIYYGNKTDMSESILKIVDKYDRARASKAKELGIVSTTGQINENILVTGRKLLENQLVINVYMDYDTAMGTGDKLVVGHQVKCTCSDVDTNPIISIEDGEEVDIEFGYMSISNRIVRSVEVMGLANLVLAKISENAGKMYLGIQ
jgi:hypothetical protein